MLTIRRLMVLLAGLQGLPEEVYEAADIDGTTPLQKFWFITIPALRGIILTIVLLDGIWTFRAFDPVYVMTGGGPVNSSQVLPTSIYFDAFQKLRFGYASAEAVIMFLILFAFSVGLMKLRRGSILVMGKGKLEAGKTKGEIFASNERDSLI
jgi:multiple sugar transport system permease protein